VIYTNWSREDISGLIAIEPDNNDNNNNNNSIHYSI
jgi:hypothetical protein